VWAPSVDREAPSWSMANAFLAVDQLPGSRAAIKMAALFDHNVAPKPAPEIPGQEFLIQRNVTPWLSHHGD
jgi:hypothetical protein